MFMYVFNDMLCRFQQDSEVVDSRKNTVLNWTSTLQSDGSADFRLAFLREMSAGSNADVSPAAAANWSGRLGHRLWSDVRR